MKKIIAFILVFSPLVLFSQVEVNRGTGAPTYTPCANCSWLYINESNGSLYVWDGSSSWAAAGGAAGVSNPLTGDLDMNSFSLTDGDNDEIYFVDNAWNIKGDSLMIRKPTAFSATEEFNIWFPSTVTPYFGGIGIYSRDGGGISDMRFYTSKIDGTYVPSLNMEISKDQVKFLVPGEFTAGAYSLRAGSGASSIFNTSKTTYSTMDLGTIPTGGNAGVSGLRFGNIQAGSNNFSRSGIFAEYNNAFGSNMIFQVGRRGDIAYDGGDGLRFMEVTETSATSGVARVTFPAATEIVVLGGLKDKDSQLGSNTNLLSSTGVATDWIAQSALSITESQISDLSHTELIQQWAQSRNTGGANSSITSGTAEQINATTTGTISTIVNTSEFTVQADGDLQFTGANNSVLEISINLSVNTADAATMYYYIAVNGTALTPTRIRQDHAGSEVLTVSWDWIDSDADTNDVYSVYAAPTAGTESVTITDMRIKAVRLK